MIDPVRCLQGVFEDDARYFAWCLVFLVKTEEEKIWMFFTFKVFLWLCGRNREIIYFFLSGLWRVFTLTCCSRLPVAVCVNGFFCEGGGEEIWWWRVMRLFVPRRLFGAFTLPVLMEHEKSRDREKREPCQFVRCLFFFENNFFCEEFHCIKINFWLFVSFFYSVVLRNWPWATALYSAPNPITPITTTTPRR